jgi:hypothetical protein
VADHASVFLVSRGLCGQKFTCYLLLGLTILSIPSLAFYWHGSNTPLAERALEVESSSGMAGECRHLGFTHLITVIDYHMMCLCGRGLVGQESSRRVHRELARFGVLSPVLLLSRLAGLFFTTMGSLGEGSLMCRESADGGSLTLTCPVGTIGRVEAYYGEPRGACSCPTDMQLDT